MSNFTFKPLLGWIPFPLILLIVVFSGCDDGSPDLGKKYHLEDEAPTERSDRLSEEQPKESDWQEFVGQPDAYDKLLQYVSKQVPTHQANQPQ